MCCWEGGEDEEGEERREGWRVKIMEEKGLGGHPARLRVEVVQLRGENSRLHQERIPAGYSPTEHRVSASPRGTRGRPWIAGRRK